MKIALLAPSPVPFVIGGAENLWWGWIAALNAQAGVEADLIKLPSPERSFWEIVDSYRQWARLDVSHFDRVISTKYPAWMAFHEDHHVFLQHKLRGLYDTWPSGWSPEVMCDAPPVRLLLETLHRAGDSRDALEEVFGALDALRDRALDVPPSMFALPGPLIRAVVHGLDRIGLARSAIRRYAAISATVRDRADYFPAGARVEVFHHPTLPRAAAVRCERVPAGAIFTASRLDAPKRMEWVVDAYLRSGVDAPLVIAGDGPCRAALERQAGQAPVPSPALPARGEGGVSRQAGQGRGGIHFVGRLTDAELAAAYRDALFVPFVPDREDYGLITLEALQAGKPVLTCSDAGGVTELVRNGVNGLVTKPSVEALAEGMRRLALDDALRARLAGQARASVESIQWPALADAFSRPWRKVTVVNTFPIFPAFNGGQVRMFQLYQRLAAFADVTVVCLGPSSMPGERRTLVRGLTQVVVPMSEAHAAFDRALMARLRASCTDMAAMLRPDLSPEWPESIRASCAGADVVVACHPYGFPAIRRVWDGPVVYESLNVEVDLKRSIFGHDEAALAELARVEGWLAREARWVACCSAEDAARMQDVYDLDQRPAVVPNGVDASSYSLGSVEARRDSRERLGVGQCKTALFVGSLHGPNVDALRVLLSLAPSCPEVCFVALGSVCDAEDWGALPGNVRLVGRVSDASLREWLAAADVGLNPMVSGSGTNLKMLEYAAAGLPMVSTPFGGRGGILQPGEDFVAAELDGFVDAIRHVLRDDRADERVAMVARARARAVGEGDWWGIAERMWVGLSHTGTVPPPR